MKPIAAGLCLTALLAGCAGTASHPQTAATTTSPATIPATVAPTTPTPSHHTVIHAAAPRFSYSVAKVTAAMLGGSYHAGCPVGPSELRLVHVSFWGFDNKPHVGSFVANTMAYPALVTVLQALFNARFPIHHLQPIAAYGGDDNKSMAADNTSAFNCRYAVAPGPKHWSEHAYGEAIDINPVENPYQYQGKVLPPNGAPYVTRTPYRTGMVLDHGIVWRAFRNVGWGWGGYFSSPDPQHFSATGN